jgi:hypothetical protein
MDNSISKAMCLSDVDETPWSNDDRDWFTQNPKRNYRLREAYDMELLQFGISHTKPGAWNGIIINQIVPGARIRISFFSFYGEPENTEAEALRIIAICEGKIAGAA